MKTKMILVGAIGTLLLGSLASVNAYHIDSPWVPVLPLPPPPGAPGPNPNCPTFPAGTPGTDCPNDRARGWVAGPLGLVVCEQNRPAGGGQAATNGMCSASNVAYSGYGACANGGPDAAVTGGGGSPAANPPVEPPPTCPTTWTTIYAFTSDHPYYGPASCTPVPVLGVFYDPSDPHDDVPSRALAVGAFGRGTRCVPGTPNVYGQFRVGSNTHGLLLTCDGLRPAGTLSTGGGFGVGTSLAFHYRELFAYWAAGGHVTFFVDQVATSNPDTNPDPAVETRLCGPAGSAVSAGSYWAFSRGSTAGTALTPPPGAVTDGFGCNELYDSGPSFVGGAVPSFFDIFEPDTYSPTPAAAGLLLAGSTQTVCRSPGPG